MISSPFNSASWVWTSVSRPNQYALFAKTIEVETSAPLRIFISASSHYELWIDGQWIARGPIHGDPQWCGYDELSLTPRAAGPLHIAILVHHAEAYVHCLLPAPGGLIAAFESGKQSWRTDETWRCFDLEMWSQDVIKRGWALGFGEDYDAKREPSGWDAKVFDTSGAGWKPVVLVPNSETIWSNFQPRMTPHLKRRLVTAQTFDAWRAPGAGAKELAEVSQTCDEEKLVSLVRNGAMEASIDAQGANAWTFDLGREYVGFPYLGIEAPAGLIIEVSGAELLRDGRPWIWRKGVSYSSRYHTKQGRQQWTTFGYSGFRYLHVVVRGDAKNVTIHGAGCIERKIPLQPSPELLNLRAPDEKLQKIFDLCRTTLEVGVQEHLVDCPTREQAQYWGDGVFIAQSLWKGWGEKSHLEYILACFIHAPFRADGQLSSVYPGSHTVLLDYPLIPLLGQKWYKLQTGGFYRPRETFDKALQLKRWYDAHLNSDGLVDFDFETLRANNIINFIDHPGIGWHDFPHIGIDRNGASCPLNLFFFGFLRVLAELARDLDDVQLEAINKQAERLGEAIRRTFFDGTVFHDAMKDGVLSEGTSWHANCLAVCFDLVQGDEATRAMSEMLARYSSVCRCSPYFYFFFLPALRRAGLETEALELIKREWQPMIDGGATTAWEGFTGDAKDSLCHPWSTAPFLFLLEQ